MLNRLAVANLAVVERAEVDFASGLNVLTGETGAGKSVLLGALELVLGGRADGGVVREGAKEARVEASFAVSGDSSVAALLEEAGLPACEDGELLVRRTVSAAGGGRVWVNDAATTAGFLKRLVHPLVDIHGPRANQRILEERFQREALDALGGCGEGSAVRGRYAAAWAALEAARARLADLEGAAASPDEADMLRFQVNEFAEADLSSDDEDLAERHAAAAHAEEIVASANAITEALGGDDGAGAILAKLRPEFAAAARHFPAAAQWAAEADEIAVRLEELSRTVADAASRVDADPGTLEELDARLSTVNRLRRKHGVATVAELLAVFERKKTRLDDLARRDERLGELRAAVAAAEADVKKAGAALTAARRKASGRLAKQVTAGLRGLGFAQAGFSVALADRAAAADGCDRVTYAFAPNPGEPSRPLADVASTGEAARVMLALKAALAAHDATETLVFDEIDANVGGEVGAAVGARMRELAKSHQVIAITHLPQSAACGERHLVVTKRVSGGRTRTTVEEVSGEARVNEIARMLGDRTKIVVEHARELLKAKG